MRNKIYLAVGIVVILALVGLAGCSAGVQAADTPGASVNISGQQGIWVTGQGKVTLVPDIAQLSIGVSTEADKVADAQSQASAAMDKLIAALTANGVDKKDIQTQYFNIQQMLQWDNTTQTNKITGYQVNNVLTVKIRDLTKTSTIIDAGVEAAGDLIRINGFNLDVEHPEQYYAQARQLAIQDARAKAEDLAKLSNVTLGKVAYIAESTSSSNVYPAASYNGLAVPAPAIAMPSISPGQTDVTLYVQVNYAIQ